MIPPFLPYKIGGDFGGSISHPLILQAERNSARRSRTSQAQNKKDNEDVAQAKKDNKGALPPRPCSASPPRITLISSSPTSLPFLLHFLVPTVVRSQSTGQWEKGDFCCAFRCQNNMIGRKCVYLIVYIFCFLKCGDNEAFGFYGTYRELKRLMMMKYPTCRCKQV
jgi:hypothetical protein